MRVTGMLGLEDGQTFILEIDRNIDPITNLMLDEIVAEANNFFDCGVADDFARRQAAEKLIRKIGLLSQSFPLKFSCPPPSAKTEFRDTERDQETTRIFSDCGYEMLKYILRVFQLPSFRARDLLLYRLCDAIVECHDILHQHRDKDPDYTWI